MSRKLSAVVIVRDRASSGGGIYNYYNAITPHFSASVTLCDAGRPYTFYGDHRSFGSRLLDFTPTRLLIDWFSLASNIIRRRPGVVVVNPSMDPSTFRSLKRDAANLLIARLLGQRVLCFWRGWENDCCDKPEFPGGNKSLLRRIYLLRWQMNTSCFRNVSSRICCVGISRRRFMSKPRWWKTNVSPVAPEPSTAQKGAHEFPVANLFRAWKWRRAVFELLDAFKILKLSAIPRIP